VDERAKPPDTMASLISSTPTDVGNGDDVGELYDDYDTQSARFLLTEKKMVREEVYVEKC
jgi:hypothetical protein